MIKTGKEEYLDLLLPLSKWTALTARSKILHDIISTIALLLLMVRLSDTGISTTKLFGRVQALMCFRDRDGYAVVEIPTHQQREYCSRLKVELPARVRIEEYASHLLGEKSSPILLYDLRLSLLSEEP